SAGANAQYIGVNVNGNVANVPIEGFLGDFGPNLSESNMQKVVKQMNRMHVNYVQFYDWYDRDDMPLRIVNGQPEQNWLDFMKRPISFNTVKSYIDAVHQYGMQAMLYNLIYGSQLGIPTSDDSNLNWVNPNLTKEMFLYKDTKAIQTAGENDQSFGGKLNITYMNVLNGAWKNYLCGQINNVYKYLPFDGWHVDQLGSLPDDTYSFDGYHLKWWDYGDGYGGML
ncbi:glycoside hydrolase family 66 protein, partial [Limosilactobacillus reuteri]